MAYHILAETGDAILTEDGYYILIEPLAGVANIWSVVTALDRVHSVLVAEGRVHDVRVAPGRVHEVRITEG